MDGSVRGVRFGNGELAAWAQVECVLVFSRSFLGNRHHRVYLALGGEDSRCVLVKVLSALERAVKPNVRLLGICRHEENAEKVAEALADFIGVSVQHRAD